MRQLHGLLEFRQNYFYSFGCEALRVIGAQNKELAIREYSNVIKLLFIDGIQKWALDIALDCVRRMTDEEIAYVGERGVIEEYHFRYGLFVRNRYVHPSMYHAYFMADDVSTLVEKYLIGIICADADPFEKSKMLSQDLTKT